MVPAGAKTRSCFLPFLFLLPVKSNIKYTNRSQDSHFPPETTPSVEGSKPAGSADLLDLGADALGTQGGTEPTARATGNLSARGMGEHHAEVKEATRNRTLGPVAHSMASLDKEKKRQEAERKAALARSRAETLTPGGPEAERESQNLLAS